MICSTIVLIIYWYCERKTTSGQVHSDSNVHSSISDSLCFIWRSNCHPNCGKVIFHYSVDSPRKWIYTLAWSLRRKERESVHICWYFVQNAHLCTTCGRNVAEKMNTECACKFPEIEKGFDVSSKHARSYRTWVCICLFIKFPIPSVLLNLWDRMPK